MADKSLSRRLMGTVLYLLLLAIGGVLTTSGFYDDVTHACRKTPIGGTTRLPSQRCDAYIECFAGMAFVRICAPGTSFNPTTHLCDLPRGADCIHTDTQRHGAEIRYFRPRQTKGEVKPASNYDSTKQKMAIKSPKMATLASKKGDKGTHRTTKMNKPRAASDVAITGPARLKPTNKPVRRRFIRSVGEEFSGNTKTHQNSEVTLDDNPANAGRSNLATPTDTPFQAKSAFPYRANRPIQVNPQTAHQQQQPHQPYHAQQQNQQHVGSPQQRQLQQQNYPQQQFQQQQQQQQPQQQFHHQQQQQSQQYHRQQHQQQQMPHQNHQQSPQTPRAQSQQAPTNHQPMNRAQVNPQRINIRPVKGTARSSQGQSYEGSERSRTDARNPRGGKRHFFFKPRDLLPFANRGFKHLRPFHPGSHSSYKEGSLSGTSDFSNTNTESYPRSRNPSRVSSDEKMMMSMFKKLKTNTDEVSFQMADKSDYFQNGVTGFAEKKPRGREARGVTTHDYSSFSPSRDFQPVRGYEKQQQYETPNYGSEHNFETNEFAPFGNYSSATSFPYEKNSDYPKDYGQFGSYISPQNDGAKAYASFDHDDNYDKYAQNSETYGPDDYTHDFGNTDESFSANGEYQNKDENKNPEAETAPIWIHPFANGGSLIHESQPENHHSNQRNSYPSYDYDSDNYQNTEYPNRNNYKNSDNSYPSSYNLEQEFKMGSKYPSGGYEDEGYGNSKSKKSGYSYDYPPSSQYQGNKYSSGSQPGYYDQTRSSYPSEAGQNGVNRGKRQSSYPTNSYPRQDSYPTQYSRRSSSNDYHPSDERQDERRSNGNNSGRDQYHDNQRQNKEKEDPYQYAENREKSDMPTDPDSYYTKNNPGPWSSNNVEYPYETQGGAEGSEGGEPAEEGGSHTKYGRKPPTFDTFPFNFMPKHLTGPMFSDTGSLDFKENAGYGHVANIDMDQNGDVQYDFTDHRVHPSSKETITPKSELAIADGTQTKSASKVDGEKALDSSNHPGKVASDFVKEEKAQSNRHEPLSNKGEDKSPTNKNGLFIVASEEESSPGKPKSRRKRHIGRYRNPYAKGSSYGQSPGMGARNLNTHNYSPAINLGARQFSPRLSSNLPRPNYSMRNHAPRLNWNTQNLSPNTMFNTHGLAPRMGFSTQQYAPNVKIDTRRLSPRLGARNFSPRTNFNTQHLSPKLNYNTQQLSPNMNFNTDHIAPRTNVQTPHLSPKLPSLKSGPKAPKAPNIDHIAHALSTDYNFNLPFFDGGVADPFRGFSSYSSQRSEHKTRKKRDLLPAETLTHENYANQWPLPSKGYGDTFYHRSTNRNSYKSFYPDPKYDEVSQENYNFGKSALGDSFYSKQSLDIKYPSPLDPYDLTKFNINFEPVTPSPKTQKQIFLDTIHLGPVSDFLMPQSRSNYGFYERSNKGSNSIDYGLGEDKWSDAKWADDKWTSKYSKEKWSDDKWADDKWSEDKWSTNKWSTDKWPDYKNWSGDDWPNDDEWASFYGKSSPLYGMKKASIKGQETMKDSEKKIPTPSK